MHKLVDACTLDTRLTGHPNVFSAHKMGQVPYKFGNVSLRSLMALDLLSGLSFDDVVIVAVEVQFLTERAFRLINC